MGSYKSICAISQTKLGRTHVVEHEIATGSHKPISSKPYKASPENKKIIKEELKKMEKDGIITQSYSPWSSPVVIVERKMEVKDFV